MSSTRLAVIGAGAIGRAHVGHILRTPGLALAGIADPAPAAQALAQAAGVPWFADHRSLLAQARPQGAVVATPNVSHVDVACDCLQRGVATLVEKPVADTVEAARRLVAAEAAHQVPVLVGHHRRHNPINRRARELIAQGRLGRLVAATALALVLKPERYFEAAWRREPGGGPVLINLIHDIDMLRFLVGEVTEVQAADSRAVRGFAVEDTAAAVLRFDNGALGTVLASDTAASPWCWDFGAGEQPQYPRQEAPSHFIVGTEGSLSLPDLALWHYTGERHWHAEMTRAQTTVHAADPYALQLSHFAAVIEGREAPLCSALDGLRTLQATLAIHEAAATGRPCVLPR